MIKDKASYITSAEAALILGFSADHVRKLCAKGKLKGEKLGRNWIINKKELSKVKRQRFKGTENSTNGCRSK